MSKRGITLISLVITVIVLLILATVAINLAVNSEGLFTKTGDAANKWNAAVVEEGDTLGDLFTQLDNISPMPVSISEKVPEEWNEGVTKVAVTGNRQVPIPEGFTVSGVEGENTISGGLVIYETDTTVTEATHETALTEYNQYVWIPVDNINDMVMCKAHGAAVTLDEETLECPTCKAANNETALAGKLYIGTDEIVEMDGEGYNINYAISACKADFTKNNQVFIDDEDDEEGTKPAYREPDDLITATSSGSLNGQAGDSSEIGIAAIKTILNNTSATTYDEIKEAWNELLKTDFENMAKSVAKYKGFYVSRYEIGTGVVSKQDKDVLLDANSSSAWYGLFSSLRSDPDVVATTYTQMIWGCEYDQVIKFIGAEAQIGHRDRNISNAEAKSGKNGLDIMKNLYDMEGNYNEYTAEASGTGARSVRGGFPMMARLMKMYHATNTRFGYAPANGDNSAASRIALYIAL